MDNILPSYRITELPSRFIGYPDMAEISVQPYTAGQAINIELAGRDNINSMEERLHGVNVQGISKEDLSPQDIIFLGVYRNLVSSQNDKINIRSICPKCLAENNEAKSLAVIKFKELEGFDKDCYPIEVDFDNYVMKFEFLTYKAFKHCLNKYHGAKLYQMAYQVSEYTDKETQETFKRPYYSNDPNERRSTSAFDLYIKKVRNILFDLVDEDKDALNEVIDLLEDYGTKPIEVTCSDERCKHKYSVNLNEEGVLVMPFRESRESSRTRIKLRKSDINKSNSIQADEFEGSGNASRNSNQTEKQAAIAEESSEVKLEPALRRPRKPAKQIEYFESDNSENLPVK